MNHVRDSVHGYVTDTDQSDDPSTRDLKHITINEDEIRATAEEFGEDDFELEEWRMPVFPDEEEYSREDVLDFFFLGNTINFAFRDFESGEKFGPVEYADIPWGGAFGMWASLRKELDEGTPILEGEYLRDLSKDKLGDIFEPDGETEIPMLDERLAILNQVGETLAEDYDGRFHTFIDQTEDRLYAAGDGIVERLVREFPSFEDTYGIDGHEINLYKRAQLAPSMAYGRLQGDPIEIEDMEAFTVFADYNLPNILRHYDILEYDDGLESRIEEGHLLEEGSSEEVELRAATVYAADRLMDEINERRDEPIYGPEMDVKLFHQRDEVETEVHRTETTAY